MFDAEKILGSLISGAIGNSRGHSGRQGLGGLLGGNINKASIGMGIIGLAAAAYEHYTQSQNTTAAAHHSPQTPPAMKHHQSATPPPIPDQQTPPHADSPVVPPPPPPPGVDNQKQQQSLLLLQSMVAAAHADGEIDAEERARVLQQIQQAGSDAEGIAYFEKLLASPPDLDTIVAQVDSNELAQQVYMISLLTITVDCEAEENYLQKLAEKLALSEDQVRQLEAQFKNQPH